MPRLAGCCNPAQRNSRHTTNHKRQAQRLRMGARSFTVDISGSLPVQRDAQGFLIPLFCSAPSAGHVKSSLNAGVASRKVLHDKSLGAGPQSAPPRAALAPGVLIAIHRPSDIAPT